MPLLLDTVRPGSATELRDAPYVTIGLVNNMPDAAIEATERQFAALLRAATGKAVVRLLLFSLADVPRSDAARRTLSARYQDISDLWSAQLDGLIVTGTEPRAANLMDEPYWPALATLVDWAQRNTASTIWSCLAAHAAVLHADGIARRPLSEKCFGVFDCEALGHDPIFKGVPRRLVVPHSRGNDLPEPALVSAGYRVLTRSAAAGVDMFAGKPTALPSQFLFFQGHPEYEADTLLREYRRDVGRFLRAEREFYPRPPQGYFDSGATALAEAFRDRAVEMRSDDLMAEFPMRALEARLAGPWQRGAAAIYRNWVEYLSVQKAARRARALALPRRRGAVARGAAGLRPAADSLP